MLSYAKHFTHLRIILTNICEWAFIQYLCDTLASPILQVDETGNIFRSTYPAFHVGRHSGSVESGKTIQVFTEFLVTSLQNT